MAGAIRFGNFHADGFRRIEPDGHPARKPGPDRPALMANEALAAGAKGD